MTGFPRFWKLYPSEETRWGGIFVHDYCGGIWIDPHGSSPTATVAVHRTIYIICIVCKIII